jgi:monoamine oxidase
VFRCAGGNQRLARALAGAIGTARVRLGTTVTGVEIADTSARVSLARGPTLEADCVILAVPPPVWNRIAIRPGLPPALVPQMASNVKFLMALGDRRAWRNVADLMSDGAVNLTWEGTDGQKTRGAGMVAFSGAASADECRAWPAAERTNRYLAALEPIYPVLRSAFVRARFMDWPADAWVKASYSFPAPGQVTLMGPMMAEPIARRLHLAGEHTCYAFVGYMEGALQSGARVASRVLNGEW